MNAFEKNLLMRVARRLEEQADLAWRAAVTAPTAMVKEINEAKRRRDRELGDAKEVREYVKRTEAAQAPIKAPDIVSQ